MHSHICVYLMNERVPAATLHCPRKAVPLYDSLIGAMHVYVMEGWQDAKATQAVKPAFHYDPDIVTATATLPSYCFCFCFVTTSQRQPCLFSWIYHSESHACRRFGNQYLVLCVRHATREGSGYGPPDSIQEQGWGIDEGNVPQPSRILWERRKASSWDNSRV
jgi:hypothetical protein